jgi:hypothetical protein
MGRILRGRRVSGIPDRFLFRQVDIHHLAAYGIPVGAVVPDFIEIADQEDVFLFIPEFAYQVLYLVGGKIGEHFRKALDGVIGPIAAFVKMSVIGPVFFYPPADTREEQGFVCAVFNRQGNA